MTPSILAVITFLCVTVLLMILYIRLEVAYLRMRLNRRFNGKKRGPRHKEKTLEERLWFKLTYPLGRFTTPDDEEALSALQVRLNHAGYRDSSAVALFFGLRAGLAGCFGVLALLWALGSGGSPLLAFLPAGMGYQAPAWALAWKIKKRKKAIFRELPDALDLLIICIDSGLGFDMAIARISGEFASITPTLAKEFELYLVETRSGLPRAQALSHLAVRNGSSSLGSVVTVLNQSARFGTDIADALRTTISSMRKQRKQLAEEKGGKVAAKLTFPLVGLIMPALMIIILGPAIINLIERFKHGF
ncbi:type II secretion system F family protein [Desulfoluna butyratoxydans]|uniref:Type ii secretion system f domain n=1 Tax=Desulfoluna butyratoxydans TaxID=231438 RepID=A0A4U8YR29_9BACT|nr:type II secretion system F family protein [Desulfoluna butyratoxydans]VFQ46174.1 type ii secretion system f domain [Desulfoluna butyratoxydans]